jgi:hypothetical protein
MRLHVEEDKLAMKIVEFITSRLKEKSTWAGLTTIAALVGINIDPEQFSAIGTAVIAIIGAIEVFRREKK